MEFHFNPQVHQNIYFDTFLFTPFKKEKNLGTLSVFAMTKRLSKDRKELLNHLVNLLKKTYFSNPNRSCREALNYSFQSLNNYIENMESSFNKESGFSMFVAAIKDDKINVSKIGDIKIAYFEEGNIQYLDERIKEKNAFKNIISGRMGESSKMIVANKSLYSFLEEKKLVEKMFECKSEKEFEKVLKSVKEPLWGSVLYFLPGEDISNHRIFTARPKINIKKSMEKIKRNNLLFLTLLLVLILLLGYILAKSQDVETEDKSLLSVEKSEETLENNNYNQNFGYESIAQIPEQYDLLGQKISFSGENIYISNSLSSKILLYNIPLQAFIPFNFSKNISLIRGANDDSVMLFSSPDTLYVFKDYQMEKEIELNLLSDDQNFEDFFVYQDNLYFLDKINGEVVEYFYKDQTYKDPVVWVKKDPAGLARSFSVDSSLWILNNNNDIEKYYQKELESINSLDIYPAIQEISKIYTTSNLNHIFLLDSFSNRIIILDKDLNLVSQLHNDNWNNIIDFTVSDDGKYLYLLNGSEILEASLL